MALTNCDGSPRSTVDCTVPEKVCTFDDSAFASNCWALMDGRPDPAANTGTAITPTAATAATAAGINTRLRLPDRGSRAGRATPGSSPGEPT